MRTRRFLAVAGATLVGACLPSLPAFAQREDLGDYRILQARYGTAARNIDVTRRLQQLAREDRPVRITNDLFGTDPDFGHVKTLRIYARGRDGAVRMFEYRENDFVDGGRFTGWRGGRWGDASYRGGWDVVAPGHGALQIVRATYGDGRFSSEVTDRVRSLVRNGRLDIEVENRVLGIDPARGRAKLLVVIYTVDGRPQQEARVPEHGRLSLP